jgi:hypothetical protein
MSITIFRARHLPRQNRWIGEGLLETIDRSGRHPLPVQPIEPFLPGPGSKDTLQLTDQFSSMAQPVGAACESGLGSHLVPFDSPTKLAPHFFSHDGYAEIIVPGLECLERNDRRVARAYGFRQDPGKKIVRCLIAQKRKLGVQKRNVHQPPLSGKVSLAQSGENADHREERAGKVAGGGAHAQWRPSRFPGQAHHSAQSLNGKIEGGTIAVRGFRAERGDRAADDPWIYPLKCWVIDLELR